MMIKYNLVSLDSIDPKDYFDQKDEETLIFFVELEIHNVFRANTAYVSYLE